MVIVVVVVVAVVLVLECMYVPACMYVCILISRILYDYQKIAIPDMLILCLIMLSQAINLSKYLSEYHFFLQVIDEFMTDKDKLPSQRRPSWRRPKLFPLVVGMCQ